MTFDEVFKYFGSGYMISLKCGFSTGAPYNWRKQGFIPLDSQRKIEKTTKGELKASIDHIPDIKKFNEKE